jgi:hypothetical protein
MSDIFALDDDVPFAMRLAETIAWCNSRFQLSDIRRSLRNIELQPNLLAGSRAEVVRSVVFQRSNALRKSSLKPVKTRDDLMVGGLLCYFPDEEVWDGASQAASYGFFDERDAPPWDTWAGLFSDINRGQYLVSWIPYELKKLVNQGIEVNPVACIGWLENEDLLLSKQLRELGLIR